MPSNPSRKQSEASRRNLRGKEGPKTIAGKEASAANGAKNRGTKTAKARAKIIAGRQGLNDDSFYARAGCLSCQKHCMWPSFSVTTRFNQMPLGCLEEVLVSQPDLCFYYLEGLCLADFREGSATPAYGTICVTEPRFLRSFRPRDTAVSDEALNRLELGFRNQIISFVNEAELYLRRLRQQGCEETELHPRMIRILRILQDVLRRCRPCRFTGWKGHYESDDCLRWIAEGGFDK